MMTGSPTETEALAPGVEGPVLGAEEDPTPGAQVPADLSHGAAV